ncbi:MAG: tRNA (uridine(34)/cytosine(34)/5-carboxymethylaminomethyluridine(34)-2'-O)-methyltransferase TrmL [Lachnospiraceae bacterium]|nr:tRNA (uridine(34)/cytosine(34)/5-carboxymethylaminomethyluridine(34)-2'-O)-methyltransferase TrmL [Lachnospiraceae bacterium]
MNIVLYQPEIPSNTGNIGRTCVATGTALHLIEPLGFRLNDKMIRRSGMDYWDKVELHRYLNWQEFLDLHPDAPLFFSTTKGTRRYTDMVFPEDAFLVFGRESGGIPMEILSARSERCMRIPMLDENRSLNLANSVSIVLYEALRQQDFQGLR